LSVGRQIDVGEVLSRAWEILSKHPMIMLPQAVLLVPTLLGDLRGGFAIDALRLLAAIFSIVFVVMVYGAYPFMVQEILAGREPALGAALGSASGRFWSLVGGGILVLLIVGLGTIALVVPGIIFATWYAYTVPAMMLEGKGATEGMSASRAFGRDKKMSTFTILLSVALVGLLISVVQISISLFSPAAGDVVSALLDVPLAAFASVALSYAYISFGPSVNATHESPGMTQTPQPQSGTSAPSRFCTSCGAAVQPGSRFCESCGRHV
jgi:hypothetical protein